MIKILNIIKIASFVVLVLTSIPMIVCYFLNTTPHIIFIVDIHVISGVLFIITAIPSMIISKHLRK